MKIIDPHIHLFNLSQGDYHWLKPENPPFWPDKAVIHQDFNERDLSFASVHVSSQQTLAGFVHIEAGFNNENPWQEIAWLEQTCQLPFKSIACFDLTKPVYENKITLERLKQYPSFVGVRHILDKQAHTLLSHQNCQANMALLAEQNLLLEVQLSLSDHSAVELLIEHLNTHQQLKLVINHAGLPEFDNSKAYSHWQSNLKKLATATQSGNCYIKCSGWEMFDRNYQFSMVFKVIEQVVKSFGEEKVLLASNFPLVKFSTNYHTLWREYLALNLESDLLERDLLERDLLEKLVYQNAKSLYRF